MDGVIVRVAVGEGETVNDCVMVMDGVTEWVVVRVGVFVLVKEGVDVCVRVTVGVTELVTVASGVKVRVEVLVKVGEGVGMGVTPTLNLHTALTTPFSPNSLIPLTRQ